MSDYKVRVAEAIESALPDGLESTSTLDFGSGDGWYWNRFEQTKAFGTVTGVDVQLRDAVIREPLIYDGSTLPYADRDFELSYAIDVLHHCPDPVASLTEMARCTRGWLVLKDHVARNSIDFAALSVLDEVGNRKFGIPSRYHYQRKWEWLDAMSDLDFELMALDWPVDANGGLLGHYTKRLNFVGVWRRR